MNRILLVLVFFAASCNAQFSQTVVAASLGVAPGLGFSPRPGFGAGYESRRFWTSANIAPLNKNSVNGGINYGVGASVGVLPLNAAHISFLTVGAGWSSMTNDTWTKSSGLLSIGPLWRFKDGTQAALGFSIRPGSPNHEKSIVGSGRVPYKNFYFGMSAGVTVFDQPFVQPQLHNLVGWSATTFVGYRFLTLREAHRK